MWALNSSLSRIPNTIHLELVFVRAESSIGKYEDLYPVLSLEAGEVAALVVEQEECRHRRESSAHLGNVAYDYGGLDLTERFQSDELRTLD